MHRSITAASSRTIIARAMVLPALPCSTPPSLIQDPSAVTEDSSITRRAFVGTGVALGGAVVWSPASALAGIGTTDDLRSLRRTILKSDASNVVKQRVTTLIAKTLEALRLQQNNVARNHLSELTFYLRGTSGAHGVSHAEAKDWIKTAKSIRHGIKPGNKPGPTGPTGPADRLNGPRRHGPHRADRPGEPDPPAQRARRASVGPSGPTGATGPGGHRPHRGDGRRRPDRRDRRNRASLHGPNGTNWRRRPYRRNRAHRGDRLHGHHRARRNHSVLGELRYPDRRARLAPGQPHRPRHEPPHRHSRRTARSSSRPSPPASTTSTPPTSTRAATARRRSATPSRRSRRSSRSRPRATSRAVAPTRSASSSRPASSAFGPTPSPSITSTASTPSTRSRTRSPRWQRRVRPARSRTSGSPRLPIDQIERARAVVPIAAVQNEFSLEERKHEEVVDHCDRERHRLRPVLPAARRRRRARGDRGIPRRHPCAGAAGLASAALAGHRADPRNALDRAPALEPRGP